MCQPEIGFNWIGNIPVCVINTRKMDSSVEEFS
jgi:hypothetical protein